jgi:two-component system response regulator
MISVLLVDHALENPRSIRKLLSVSGNDFKLTCVNSYREILQGFRSKTYDVCLIDSAVDNGLKLFAQARSLGCTAPMVIVTSTDARETIRAIRSGVADCLIRDELSAAGIEHSLCCVVEQARSISLQDQRERRYLALLDNANEIVYTHDLRGNFTSINRTGEQLTGYSQSEFLEMNVWQLVAPEYRLQVEKMIARTLDAQTQISDEVELVTKYGCNLMVEINTHPINHDGKTIEIQGIANTPAGLLIDRPWESRGLTARHPANAALEKHEVLILHPYSAADSFLLPENSLRSGRTLLSL